MQKVGGGLSTRGACSNGCATVDNLCGLTPNEELTTSIMVEADQDLCRFSGQVILLLQYDAEWSQNASLDVQQPEMT
jgi:hypothetical protein